MSKPRNSGLAFEAHVASELKLLAAGKPSTLDPLNLDQGLVSALRGAVVYAPWTEVPAGLLVSLGWEPRDVHERRKLYEGPADQRGWREYGGDWVVERSDVQGAVLMGQDKDHEQLSVGCLGRFLMVAGDAYEHNHETLGLPNGTPSAVLCFPKESHVSQRDHAYLCKMKMRAGLHLLGFPDFQAKPGLDPEADPMDEESNESLVPLRTPPRPLSPSLRPVPTAAEVPPNPEAPKTVYSLAMPTDGQKRAFQTRAANVIVKNAGLYLVKAPPGCGKTAIMATVVGSLVRWRSQASTHDTRRGKPRLAFLTAPCIDHAKQLLLRLERVLSNAFGKDWKTDVVEFVGDATVASLETLKTRLAAGVRVFISTDRSATLLLALAEHAVSLDYPLLCVKDEAHYNADHASDSTKLLLLAERQAKGFAVACTATPDGDVMKLPNLKIALDYGLKRAVDKGFCAPYEVVLPLLTSKGDDEHLPVEAKDLARADRLGAAALFCIAGMMNDGVRKCVAYARDTAEAKALKTFLGRACAFHGAECVVSVVTEETKQREALYDAFQSGETQVRRVQGQGRVDLVKPVLHFLIGVQILDQCVDLPKCDSIFLSSPPTSSGDVKSAHRAIQRLGRATRPKPGKRSSVAYIFSDHDNPWLHQFFGVLSQFDPGCKQRVRVASSNPVTRFDPSMITAECASLEALREKYDIGGTRRDAFVEYKDSQIAEMARLVRLVHAKAVDPRTGKKAVMPCRSNKELGLGVLWPHMKHRGHRLGELQSVLGPEFPLKAFVEAQKLERAPVDYTKEEQIQELARLVRLVHTGQVDHKTGEKAVMPFRSIKGLGLGNLWDIMKHKGQRLGELKSVLGPDFPLQAFIQSQKRSVDYTRDEQIQELTRLVLLVHAGQDDPRTGKKAVMPVSSTKGLGLGTLWNDMKHKGVRLGKLQSALGSGFPLQDFIQSQKKNPRGCLGKRKHTDLPSEDD